MQKKNWPKLEKHQYWPNGKNNSALKMNEDQYRKTYQAVNHQRCALEKLVLLHYGHCQYAEKLLLAEREAMACHSESAQKQCLILLDELRKNARFSLQRTQMDGPLPHAQEIKIQAGGIFGLQQALKQKDTANIEHLHDEHLKFDNDKTRPIENVYQVIIEGIKRFGSISQFPYGEIVKSIIHFQIPKRSRRKKK